MSGPGSGPIVGRTRRAVRAVCSVREPSGVHSARAADSPRPMERQRPDGGRHGRQSHDGQRGPRRAAGDLRHPLGPVSRNFETEEEGKEDERNGKKRGEGMSAIARI